MDRGYLDFATIVRAASGGGFFVTRAKRNFKCQRFHSLPVDRSTGLICDHVMLNEFYAAQDYPERLRRIRSRIPRPTRPSCS